MRLPTLPWFVDQIRASSLARSVGAPIAFGREAMTRTIPTGNAIIIDVARGDGIDAFGPPNPSGGRVTASDGTRRDYVYHRAIVGEALIVCASNKAGARRQDHVELCDAILNNFLFCARETARVNKTTFAPLGGGYPRPEDETEDRLAAGFAEHGARYILRFSLAVPVTSTPIDVGEVGGASTTINVPFNGSDYTTEVSV